MGSVSNYSGVKLLMMNSLHKLKYCHILTERDLELAIKVERDSQRCQSLCSQMPKHVQCIGFVESKTGLLASRTMIVFLS